MASKTASFSLGNLTAYPGQDVPVSRSYSLPGANVRNIRAILTWTGSGTGSSRGTIAQYPSAGNRGNGGQSLDVSSSFSGASGSFTLTFRCAVGPYYAFDYATVSVTYESDDTTYAPSAVSATAADVAGQTLITVVNARLSELWHAIIIDFGSKRTNVDMVRGAVQTNLTIPWEFLETIPASSSGVGMVTCNTFYGLGPQDPNNVYIGTTTAPITIRAPQSVAPAFTLSCAHNTHGHTLTHGYVAGISGAELTVTLDPDTTVPPGKYRTGIVRADWPSGFVPDSSSPTTAASLSVIPQAGQQTFQVTLADERGLHTVHAVTIDVRPYSRPVLESVDIFRCNQSGNADDDGAYISAQVSAAYSDLDGDNDISITVTCMDIPNFGTLVLQNGVKTVESVLGMTAGQSYRFTVTATDTMGNSTTRTVVVAAATMWLHFRDDGGGVAVGQPSTEDGFEVRADWPFRAYGEEVLDLIVPVGIVIQLKDTLDPANIYPNTVWSEIGSASGGVRTWQRQTGA